jgi:hypothetical protein
MPRVFHVELKQAVRVTDSKCAVGLFQTSPLVLPQAYTRLAELIVGRIAPT